MKAEGREEKKERQEGRAGRSAPNFPSSFLVLEIPKIPGNSYALGQ